jgi:16S rRNA (guanine527-N7)-methyltransferase
MTGTAIPEGLDGTLDSLNVSRESRTRLTAYVQLLLTWQARINLIGPATVAEVWQRHILDSLQLLPLLRDPGSVADLGSGAGLPGLIIGIATGRHIDLYESNQKKAAFLREAARVTKCDARVHCIRLEKLADEMPPSMPRYVTARALAPLNLLLQWASPLLVGGATGLFHKGQDLDSELTEATKYWKMKVIRHPSMTDSCGSIIEITDLGHAD